MLYFKMMSNQDMDDSDPNKNHTCLTVDDCKEYSFNTIAGENQGEHNPALFITHKDGSETVRAIIGKVYVMNEAGKTIDSFGI